GAVRNDGRAAGIGRGGRSREDGIGARATTASWRLGTRHPKELGITRACTPAQPAPVQISWKYSPRRRGRAAATGEPGNPPLGWTTRIETRSISPGHDGVAGRP